MEEELPPQLQHQVMRLQQFDQQMRILATQKTQLEAESRDTERALEELEKIAPNTAVYKSIGTLLLKADPEKLKEELQDKKETLEMRIKTLERQEERTRKQMDQLRTQLEQQLQQRGLRTAG